MTIVVAFDTVFEQCSVAVLQKTQDGPMEQLLYEKTVPGNRGQTELILPMLEEALEQTGLGFERVDAWVFNRGPGAFSGIRINTAVVQALSVANGSPCVGISSLLALADLAHRQQNFADGSLIACVMDARQDQVYLGYFTIKDAVIIPVNNPDNPYGNEYLVDYDSLIECDILVGDGGHLVQSEATRLAVSPKAVDLARLGLMEFLRTGGVPADLALPVYLRDKAWKTLAEQGKK